jgi:hypothetical protein
MQVGLHLLKADCLLNRYDSYLIIFKINSRVWYEAGLASFVA